MLTDIVLVLNVLFYSFYVAGHTFDLLASVPNWKSGNVTDVAKMRDFYAVSTPKKYFLPLVILTPVISLLGLIMVWASSDIIVVFMGVSFVIALSVFILTIRFFVPINQYLMETNEYESNKLSNLVRKWVSMDYIRITLLIIGLIASIISMYFKIGL